MVNKFNLKAEMHMHCSYRDPKHYEMLLKDGMTYWDLIKKLMKGNHFDIDRYFGSRNRVGYPPFFIDSVVLAIRGNHDAWNSYVLPPG